LLNDPIDAEIRSDVEIHTFWLDLRWIVQRTKEIQGSISSGAGRFSHLLEEMAYIIQTTDEGQLQCLTIESALPAG
jgi:hypothetical protein